MINHEQVINLKKVVSNFSSKVHENVMLELEPFSEKAISARKEKESYFNKLRAYYNPEVDGYLLKKFPVDYISRRGFKPKSVALSYLEAQNFNLEDIDGAHKQVLVESITRVVNQALKAKDALDDGDDELLKKICLNLVSYGARHGLGKLNSGELGHIDLHEMISSFVREKKNLGCNGDYITSVMKSFMLLHALIEKNNLRLVTRDDANTAVSRLRQYPKNANGTSRHGEFSKKTPYQIWESCRNLKIELMKSTTVSDHIIHCSTVYNWLIVNGMIDYNPFRSLARLDPNLPELERIGQLPFSKEDLKKIFSNKVFTRLEYGVSTRSRRQLYCRFWVPLICLFTGMRPGEPTMLRKEDIVNVGGIYCFILRVTMPEQRLKNENAWRVIPIHSKLIDLGLIEFVQSIKPKERVFSELNFNSKNAYFRPIGEWFDDNFCIPLGFKGSKKSFYSFRHSFVKTYKRLYSSDIALDVKKLVGHDAGIYTYEAYGNDFSLADIEEVKHLKNIIELIDFEDCLTCVQKFRK